MVLTFDLASAQIDGARKYQEDAFLITHLTDKDGNPSSLVIVADGMGGHAAGNVASNMAVQAFAKHVSANYPTDSLGETLNEAVLKANDSIQETIKETAALAGMGCTMIACILEAGSVWWASVGDSHLYVIRDGALEKKNDDHSYGGFLERMAAAGTPVEPQKGLARNMLMSALTGERINEINIPEQPYPLLAGDRVLLCSDGMDTLNSGQIIEKMSGSDSPKECADGLMDAVTEAKVPKQDNTTAVVVLVREQEDFRTQTGVAAEEALEITAPQGERRKGREAKPEAEPGEKKKWLPAAAAVAVVCVGAGLFFLMRPGDKPSPTPTVAEAPAPEPAPPPEPTVAEAPEPEPPPAEVAEVPEPPPPAPAPEPPPPAVAETPAPAPAPEPSVAAPAVVETPPPAPVAPEPAPPPQVATAPPQLAPEPAVSAPAPAPGKTLQDPLKSGGLGPMMVMVPAGSYEMGSTSLSRYAEERPRRAVQVNGFAVSQHEITYQQYAAFAESTGRKLNKKTVTQGEEPIHYVSWDDAYAYAKWLAQETGKGYRLLNEAEWEYMATGAGASKTAGFWWGFDPETGKAHCFDCDSGLDPRRPTKVGRFDPNQLGIHDTAGNVSEWVHDCWHPNYEGAPTVAEVWEGGDCSYRVARGGSYADPMQSLRVSKRFKFPSKTGNDLIGIRVGYSL